MSHAVSGYDGLQRLASIAPQSCDLRRGFRGRIEVLSVMVAGLPANFPGAVCVVLHLSPTFPSSLPEIVSHAGPLPAHFASRLESLSGGTIYVAPMDRHLIIENGFLEFSQHPYAHSA